MDTKPLSKQFLGFMVAIVIVGGLITFLEYNVNKRSAMALFILVIASMLLTQPLVVARISSFATKISEAY